MHFSGSPRENELAAPCAQAVGGGVDQARWREHCPAGRDCQWSISASGEPAFFHRADMADHRCNDDDQTEDGNRHSPGSDRETLLDATGNDTFGNRAIGAVRCVQRFLKENEILQKQYCEGQYQHCPAKSERPLLQKLLARWTVHFSDRAGEFLKTIQTVDHRALPGLGAEVAHVTSVWHDFHVIGRHE